MPETPKRRGPQPSGKALSGAERQRRYIERLKGNAVSDTVSNNAVSDELTTAHARIAELESLVANLQRSRSEHLDALTEMDNKIRLRERATKMEINRLTRDLNEARAELAAIRAIPPRPAPKQKPVTDGKNERGYPTNIKCLAVEMADAGKTTPEIRAAIMDACGKAPDTSNIARLIRGWRDAGKAA